MALAAVPLDALGVTRPKGSAYDKGAYEFVSTVPLPPITPTGLNVLP